MSTASSTITAGKEVGEAIDRLQKKFEAHTDFTERVATLLPPSSIHDALARRRDENYIREMLETYRAGRKADFFTAEVHLYLASYYVASLRDDRWLSKQYDADLEPINSRIRLIEHEHGIEGGDGWLIGEGPEEYDRLNEDYGRILDSKAVEIFRELGETEFADLLERDPKKFNEVEEVGRKAFIDKTSVKDKLRALLERYKQEADLSFKAGAYYGACALIGTCLETTLLLLCHAFPEKAEQSRMCIPRIDNPPRGSDPNAWGLNDLIRITDISGWLPIITTESVELNAVKWLDFIRDWRNLLHPGKHVKKMPQGQIAAQEYEDAKAVYTIVELLYIHLIQAIE